MKATSIIRNSILGIGVAASLAAGSMGIGSAEARINGDPASPGAQACKNVQDLYDAAVRAYWAASTPTELLSARAELNIWADRWNELGCNNDYGDIRFIVAGGSNVLNSGLTLQQVAPSGPATSTGAPPMRGK